MNSLVGVWKLNSLSLSTLVTNLYLDINDTFIYELWLLMLTQKYIEYYRIIILLGLIIISEWKNIVIFNCLSLLNAYKWHLPI